MKQALSVKGFLKEYAAAGAPGDEASFAYAKKIASLSTLKATQTHHAALYCVAVGQFYQAQYPECEKTLKSFIFDFRKFPFEPFYVDSFSLLSLVQFAKKRFYLSIFYGKQALALAEEHKLVDHYSMIYSNLAAPYRELGTYSKALQCIEASLTDVKFSSEPSIELGLTYNKAALLLNLGQYQASREALAEMERLGKAHPDQASFFEYLPLAKAEIAICLHEESNLQALALEFLHSPNQDNPAVRAYLLDDDLSLYTLLTQNGLDDEAALFLAKIEEIVAAAPSLDAQIFIAKAKRNLALKNGDETLRHAAEAELVKLYEEQQKGYAADFAEITALHFGFVKMEEAYAKAQKKASHFKEESDTDALTGLRSRRALEKEKKMFPLLAKKSPYFVLALLDYDHFKSINDGYGYQIGDLALRLGGHFFKSFESPTKRIFRYGGDEVVFALGVKDPEEAATFFQQMKAGLEAVDLHTPDGVKIPLSCCIGYALFKGSYKSWSPALKEANEAIHAAKAIGRGNIVSVAG
jgi:diguanylate cyclase (GGDEF)-like protein